MSYAFRITLCVGFTALLSAQTPSPPTAKGIQLARATEDSSPVADDSSPASEDRVAVVVGVNHYDVSSGFSSLQYSVNDADAMSDALKHAGYLVKLVPESDASAGAILDAIEQQGKMLAPVRGKGKQGTFLFYFSGHGTAVENQNFLVTPHANRQRLTRDALGLDEVEAALAKGPARRRILLIDACRTVQRDGTRGVGDSDRFAEFRAAEGERILLAASFGDASREFRELSHGVFTHFLLEAIQSDPSRIAGKPYLSFRDLADYVSRETRRWTNSKGVTQVPTELGQSTFDFIVTGVPNPSTPPADVADLEIRSRALVLQQKYGEALPLLRQAADRHSRLAMFGLGTLYERGRGVPQNLDLAIAWYLRAADLDEPRAYSALGSLYRFGRGVKTDYVRALNYYSKAAAAGEVYSMRAIGALYRDGLGIPQDDEQAMKWFRKAAAAGDEGSMTNIGFLYDNGLGIAGNPQEAMNWYRKAAEAGSDSAMNNLGIHYARGSAVAQDYRQAMLWYRKAADAGNSEAMTNMGDLYYNAEGVPRDYNEAMRWFSKAAEEGNRRAMRKVGVLFSKGEGAPKNIQTAIAWCRKAADAGDTEAMRVIAFFYLTFELPTTDVNEPMIWMRKAVDLGDPKAMRAIGLFYENGFAGQTKDLSQAIAWLRKAVDAGSTEAEADLKRLGAGK